MPALAAGVLALSLAAGCSDSGGPSDYDKMMAERQGAADTLTGAGAKITQKHYPLGDAWVVDLSGKPVSDNMIRQLKQVGNVAELNLSKTGLTDQHLALMHELGLHLLLFKLDLSHTAVTDAGLGHLDGNLFLSELNLTGTKVTPAGVAQFKKKREQDHKVKIKNTVVKR
jgi:hypothetical protein